VELDQLACRVAPVIQELLDLQAKSVNRDLRETLVYQATLALKDPEAT